MNRNIEAGSSKPIAWPIAWLAAVVSLLVLSACGGPGQRAEPVEPTGTGAELPPPRSPEPTTPPGPMPPRAGDPMAEADMCPMMDPGTAITWTDVDDGVALVFRTEGDVTTLRQRVQRMADMHNRHHAGHVGHGGAGAMGGPGAPGPRMEVPSTATVREIDDGAMMVLSPRDPAHREALRAHVEQMALRMQGGECPMMMMMGQHDE